MRVGYQRVHCAFLHGRFKLKILIIGNGAREHTLTWKLAQSPSVEKLYVAPGNAGTALLAENVAIKPTDVEQLATFAEHNKIDLTVVGPEAPLVAGVVDMFQSRGLPVFGPTQKAARIEASKVFSKDLMQKYGIPCAASSSFNSYDAAREYLETVDVPLVLKADGLAAGKGVILVDTREQAVAALDTIMKERSFGDAGDNVVIEEMLTGREMSVFSICDGETAIPLVPACDYKPAFDGNKGPNTGGMGSYSPPSFYTPELGKMVQETIMQPTVDAMAKEDSRYTGLLYGGLMLTGQGPKVLEYNARFGDPECQVILPRLKSDLAAILLAVAEGRSGSIEVELSDEPCVGVVLASGGYPGSYTTGLPVSGLDDVDDDIMVFHAGTVLDGDTGRVVTSGGRVLTVVAVGKTLDEARARVYDNISRITFDSCYYRTDIAKFNT